MKNIIVNAILILLLTGGFAQTSNNVRNLDKDITHEEIISDTAFQGYISKVNGELARFNSQIADMKVALMCEQKKPSNKLKRKVTSLDTENDELKIDLSNFINFGIGNWKLFKMEFNQDLAMVKNDLNEFGEYIYSEEFFAALKK